MHAHGTCCTSLPILHHLGVYTFQHVLSATTGSYRAHKPTQCYLHAFPPEVAGITASTQTGTHLEVRTAHTAGACQQQQACCPEKCVCQNQCTSHAGDADVHPTVTSPSRFGILWTSCNSRKGPSVNTACDKNTTQLVLRYGNTTWLLCETTTHSMYVCILINRSCKGNTHQPTRQVRC